MSVPYKRDGYYYYTRYEEGKNTPCTPASAIPSTTRKSSCST